MDFLWRQIASFFRAPDLPADARRTFRFHLAYAVLDAAAGGILLNAPMVGLKVLAAADWQLPMRELCVGVGMLATLYLGNWMASRPKMPFVFLPGIACALCSMAMPLATGSAAWFLALYSVSAMFEITTRPAIASILRLNYPVTHRGLATGEVRKWSSLSFAVMSLSTAMLLQTASAGDMPLIQGLFWFGSLLSLASFLCFRQIRVHEAPEACRHDMRPEVLRHLSEAVTIVVRDSRYRRYLLAFFVDGFCGMLYLSLILAFLQRRLGYGYVECALLIHTIPSLMAFAVTGRLGRWFDRTNPWFPWAWIRFGWGLDALILAATPFCLPAFATLLWLVPQATRLLPLTARVLHGAVQGGAWVLTWQIGITHFARPGEDTSRYMGIMVFLSGAVRFAASAAAMSLAAFHFQPSTLMVVGGLGVILSGVYSLWQGLQERREKQLATIADFEAMFAAETPQAAKPAARSVVEK